MPEITLEGGAKVTTFAPPPSGFDPLTASPADLVRYGFPARPEDPHHLARYRTVFGQLKHKFQYVQPTFRVNTEKRHGPAFAGPEKEPRPRAIGRVASSMRPRERRSDGWKAIG